MVGTYPVVTLCGSTEFKDQFLKTQAELTMKGYIVISVGAFSHTDENFVDNMSAEEQAEMKKMLDDMHKRKIDMADAIYVINVGGYIGKSTRSEIEYAKANGNIIRYLESVE